MYKVNNEMFETGAETARYLSSEGLLNYEDEMFNNWLNDIYAPSVLWYELVIMGRSIEDFYDDFLEYVGSFVSLDENFRKDYGIEVE